MMRVRSGLTLLFILALLAGCSAAQETPAAPSSGKMKIMSGAFADGQTIPVEFTCDGVDANPALAWEGVPEDAQSLALIVTDPDAPGRTFYHWAVYNIPPEQREIAQGLPGEELALLQAENDFGEANYRGPCPPAGSPHRYYFSLYALDTLLEEGLQGARDVEKALEGHILDHAQVMGTFGR